MSERRMFTKKIIDSDAFTELPPTTQALYFHLCMNADDDGFNNKIRQAMFNAHADRNDYDLLISKRFIIPFENKGVIVIKHWRLHNYIQNDRYHKTEYVEEKARLVLKSNGVYTENTEDVSTLDTTCIQNVSKVDTEVSIGKVSIGKSINIYSARFEETYKAYPRKGDKKRAYSCYLARIHEGYSEDELYAATKNYAEYCEKEHREQKFIKIAPTFYGVNTPFVDFLPKREELEVMTMRFENAEDRLTDPYYGLPQEFFSGVVLHDSLVKPIKDIDSGKVYTADEVISAYYSRRGDAHGDTEELEFKPRR